MVVQSITDYAGELATRMQTTEYGDVLMIPDAVPSSAFSKYFEPFGTVEELSDKYQEGYLYMKDKKHRCTPSKAPTALSGRLSAQPVSLR